MAVPSAARVSSLDYAGQALGTSSLDIAAWYPTYVPVQSGVVAAQIIGSSIFGQALFNSDGATNWTDGLGSVAQNAIPSREQPLWQKLGLVADPNCDIHLGFTVRTTNSIAGYVGLRARYIR